MEQPFMHGQLFQAARADRSSFFYPIHSRPRRSLQTRISAPSPQRGRAHRSARTWRPQPALSPSLPATVHRPGVLPGLGRAGPGRVNQAPRERSGAPASGRPGHRPDSLPALRRPACPPKRGSVTSAAT